jgi:sporulation protein YlmC with PRC-barrel domain
MSKPAKFLPVQRFIGLQVIDTRGSLVGTVKELSLDFENKEISLKVTTKNKGEMDFGWNDVQSVEDVVLLKRQVDTPSVQKDKAENSINLPIAEALMICPTCGTSAPARAKFCSKCGSDLKS